MLNNIENLSFSYYKHTICMWFIRGSKFRNTLLFEFTQAKTAKTTYKFMIASCNNYTNENKRFLNSMCCSFYEDKIWMGFLALGLMHFYQN